MELDNKLIIDIFNILKQNDNNTLKSIIQDNKNYREENEFLNIRIEEIKDKLLLLHQKYKKNVKLNEDNIHKYLLVKKKLLEIKLKNSSLLSKIINLEATRENDKKEHQQKINTLEALRENDKKEHQHKFNNLLELITGEIGKYKKDISDLNEINNKLIFKKTTEKIEMKEGKEQEILNLKLEIQKIKSILEDKNNLLLNANKELSETKINLSNNLKELNELNERFLKLEFDKKELSETNLKLSNINKELSEKLLKLEFDNKELSETIKNIKQDTILILNEKEKLKNELLNIQNKMRVANEKNNILLEGGYKPLKKDVLEFFENGFKPLKKDTLAFFDNVIKEYNQKENIKNTTEGKQEEGQTKKILNKEIFLKDTTNNLIGGLTKFKSGKNIYVIDNLLKMCLNDKELTTLTDQDININDKKQILRIYNRKTQRLRRKNLKLS